MLCKKKKQETTFSNPVPAKAELAGLEGEHEAKGEDLGLPPGQRDPNLEPVGVGHNCGNYI